MKTNATTSDYREQVEQLLKERKLMRQLVTPTGFYHYYFSELGKKEHRTKVECFNYCNDKYYDLFGEYRYSDYSSFQRFMTRQHKKK